MLYFKKLIINDSYFAEERIRRNREEKLLLFAKFVTENQDLKRSNEILGTRCRQLEEVLQMQQETTQTPQKGEAPYINKEEQNISVKMEPFDCDVPTVTPPMTSSSAYSITSSNAKSPYNSMTSLHSPSTSGKEDFLLPSTTETMHNSDANPAPSTSNHSGLLLSAFMASQYPSNVIDENTESTPNNSPLQIDANFQSSAQDLDESDSVNYSNWRMYDTGLQNNEVAVSSALPATRPSSLNKRIPATLQCHICGLSSTKKTFMKRHYIKQHPGEKPFPCEFCGRRFNDWNNYQKHRFVHTREIRFTCDICGKKFSRRDNYKSHLAMHQRRQGHNNRELTHIRDRELVHNSGNTSAMLAPASPS